tara:strand:+ start:63 stop:386 length:324 start_codon:yes stop_codon:yes gene_type:complete
MKIIKIFFFVILFGSLFYSCTTLKKGFESQRKNSTDEFLVEKKQPLVMPPDFENLPFPKSNQLENQQRTTNQIQELIVRDKSNKKNFNSNSESNLKTEDFILDKIKN